MVFFKLLIRNAPPMKYTKGQVYPEKGFTACLSKGCHSENSAIINNIITKGQFDGIQYPA